MLTNEGKVSLDYTFGTRLWGRLSSGIDDRSITSWIVIFSRQTCTRCLHGLTHRNHRGYRLSRERRIGETRLNHGCWAIVNPRYFNYSRLLSIQIQIIIVDDIVISFVRPLHFYSSIFIEFILSNYILYKFHFPVYLPTSLRSFLTINYNKELIISVF